MILVFKKFYYENYYYHSLNDIFNNIILIIECKLLGIPTVISRNTGLEFYSVTVS